MSIIESSTGYEAAGLHGRARRNRCGAAAVQAAMRYLVAITVAITVAAAALMAGCAQPPGKDAQPPAEAAQPFGNRVEGSRDAQVYEQVLRRYAESPSENSFPGKTFKTVYVLDHAHPDAADPMGQKGSGVAIPLEDQGWITAALAP